MNSTFLASPGALAGVSDVVNMMTISRPLWFWAAAMAVFVLSSLMGGQVESGGFPLGQSAPAS
jgi:hypothetical protein